MNIVAAAYFALVGFLLVWSVWLVTTPDPDGGRHPVGGLMLLVALLAGLVGLLALRRRRRG